MGPSDDFDVRIGNLPEGGIVAHVRGELDLATTPTLEEALVDLDAGPRLVIDLTECTFLDSSAVRFLTSTARETQAAGRTLALVVTDPGVLRVLEITAVDTMLPVYPTVDAAL